MNMIVITIFSIAITFFICSVFFIFNKPKRQNKLQYLILQLGSITTWITSYIGMLQLETKSFISYIGIFFIFVSIPIFFISVQSIKGKEFDLIFSKEKVNFIHRNGIYSIIRHPFYLSYLFCYFGVALYTGWFANYIMFFVMYCIYWYAALEEETKFENSFISEDYSTYKKTAMSIFPDIGLIKKSK